MDLVEKEGLEDVLVVVGGVIPNKDIPVLNEIGVKGTFPGGTRFDEITRFIKENVRH
jgi:methylmalonyl-CoA mutase C-terminal domain/subunit